MIDYDAIRPLVERHDRAIATAYEAADKADADLDAIGRQRIPNGQRPQQARQAFVDDRYAAIVGGRPPTLKFSTKREAADLDEELEAIHEAHERVCTLRRTELADTIRACSISLIHVCAVERAAHLARTLAGEAVPPIVDKLYKAIAWPGVDDAPQLVTEDGNLIPWWPLDLQPSGVDSAQPQSQARDHWEAWAWDQLTRRKASTVDDGMLRFAERWSPPPHLQRARTPFRQHRHPAVLIAADTASESNEPTDIEPGDVVRVGSGPDSITEVWWRERYWANRFPTLDAVRYEVPKQQPRHLTPTPTGRRRR